MRVSTPYFETLRLAELESFITTGAGDSFITRSLLGLCWKKSLYLRDFTKLIDPGGILIMSLYNKVGYCLS